jgi:hypothetical protein
MLQGERRSKMAKLSLEDIQNIRNKNHAPCHISTAERAWKSVKWMTGKKAADAVNEFIRSKQAIKAC